MKICTIGASVLFSVAAFSVAAQAQDQQAQQACMNDAFSICGQFIPEQGRVAKCLYSNVSRVSAPCRQILARYDRSKVTQTRMVTTR